MKFLNLAAFSGEKRQQALARLHDSTGAGAAGELVVEDLDDLPDAVLGISHAVVERPGAIGRDGFLHPLGYIELDLPVDVYSGVTVRQSAGQRGDARELQILITPDERLELIAYTAPSFVDSGRIALNVQVDHAPDKQVSTSVSVQPGQFVQPPQRAAAVSASRVVGLRAFDESACFLRELARYQLAETVLGSSERVTQSAGTRWRVLAGVENHDFVHQAVEGSTQLVEPLAEQHGQPCWQGARVMQHHDVLVIAAFDGVRNRVGLQVFGRDCPHRFTVFSGSIHSLEKNTETIDINHVAKDNCDE